jgi:hypothetical protein
MDLSNSQQHYGQQDYYDSQSFGTIYGSQQEPTYDQSQSHYTYGAGVFENSSSDATIASGKAQWVCLVSNCTQAPFKRCADLDRHYRQVHFQDAQMENFPCDYAKCSRANRDEINGAFHRKDHYRDHLRDYHKEDLPKRGSKADKTESTDRFQDRVIKLDWWRCSKCLNRVSIKFYGWECPECKVLCDRDRQEVRRAKMEQEVRRVKHR